ncbi:NAD-dependent protein deacetylase, SIR2 family [Rhodoblastus acidophilus]|uniref:NAD-dependent protein deacetylase n=1 Tax=Rhodoblastus acidophilus TaxID=1074 RepID=A0A212S8B2_RHOAC|nr:NAD-dependent protein deacetylase [Rhodoblastus acidophilus]PPQ37039.1 NAD-dependent deacetylase [Rhodoblastus acidophilus]RAI20346.1 NAD-dependent deacetylase [Rhodoblastus acidophilus]SNB81446.1 NAD-dependent protein deacetylase, SIR2 family [Rhodoblastus acidophilus]
MSDPKLRAFIASRNLFVLTGAGCSTGSGIPDYRDGDGAWKRPQPMNLATFMGSEAARQRYWARSMIGWPKLAAARPNDAHRALAALEAQGRISLLVTQNVDGLHQAAGSGNVVDLHGRIDALRCMDCGAKSAREKFQTELARLNPDFAARTADRAPDGDADLEADFSSFAVPPCPACGGVQKPDVVFFGECAPGERVEAAYAAVRAADAVLVVGSSLMVRSGLRFVEEAARLGKPCAAINLGRTRADDLLSLKVEADCAEALRFLL